MMLAMMSAAAPALALDSGDIFVVSAKGEVHVTMKGAARGIRAGSVLELPASLRTGRDGAVELRQGATTVSVGPDTALDFPALERPGAPIDRIQQSRGNAFYNIGKREGRKLRVETPYLVGVVKGTQFNVAARDEATTISLFEGLLEVRATDDSAVVDLKAGEIASRHRGDKSISVIRMDSGRLPATTPRPPGNADGNGNDGGPSNDSPRDDDPRGSLVDRDNGDGVGTAVTVGLDLRPPSVAVDSDAGVTLSGTGAAANVEVNTSLGNAVDAAASVSVSAGDNGAAVDISTGANVSAGPIATDLGLSANVDVASGNITADLGAGVGVSAGPVGADVSTSTGLDVSAGGVSIDNPVDVGVDAGPASVDVATSTSIDVGTSGISADVVADAGISAGPLVVDTGASTSIDVDTGGVGADLSTGTAVDAGLVTADLGTSTTVDIDTSGAVAVDTGAALDVAGTDVSAGVSAGVDLSSGTVDLGVSVGGLDIGLGIDLGLGATEPATDTGSSTTPATDTGNTGIVDVGGLLDGLLRRPGRK